MEAILNFNEQLDISLLDKVVNTLYQGVGSEQQQAQRLITQFQEHPDAWQKVDYVLEYSTNFQTKYLALQVLEKLIQTRWNVLPREQCDGIKNYIVSLIIKKSSDEESLKREKVFINKINLILVQILKQDWPKKWPTFITEIVGASRSNMSLCENNMVILKLLSEEIFDFSSDQMTTVKAKNLKHQLNSEFSEIFLLCSEILENATKPSLLHATLEALLRFLKWIPLGYIFETNLAEMLKTKFLQPAYYRNVAINCFTEIAGLVIDAEYDSKFVAIYNMVMSQVSVIIPFSAELDLSRQYSNASDNDQKFIQNLALFLTTILGMHLNILESSDSSREILLLGHYYLLKISLIDDREIFKITLEYWNKLVFGLYHETSTSSFGPRLGSLQQPLLMLGSSSHFDPNSHGNARRYLYVPILSELRLVMISRMVKPEEVLIVEDENGEIVREFVKETDTITLYKSMRECLVLLTHLDYSDTETLMTEKLARQYDGSEWSWSGLNRLCWAIGSISGAMNEESEKRFLVTVIRDLLGLCEIKRGKDNKAVVASNIMYVVGQYPRFLKAHWKFLKTVIQKLFEFMHETHEGVQDMACDTFIKIARKCARHMVILQPGETVPFIDEMLVNLPNIIRDLAASQAHTVYEAIGHMVAASPDPIERAGLLARLMSMPNEAWDNTMRSVKESPDLLLSSSDTLKTVGNILKANLSACRSVGSSFASQLARLFLDLLLLYRSVSDRISSQVASQGLLATKTPILRAMRAVKKDVLRLIDSYISAAEDLKMVADSFAPPLLDAILGDYASNVPAARDAEVLIVTSTLISRLGLLASELVPPILRAVLQPTLEMIARDFTEYPEHRSSFFKLIQSVVLSCFPALLRLQSSDFQLIMDSIIWAFKHTTRNIADTGLSIMLELLTNLSQADQNIRDAFYARFLIPLTQDLFFVLTDADHKSGFKLQTLLLAHIFYIVDHGIVSGPLYDLNKSASGNMNNAMYLRDFATNLLHSAFPHLQRPQVELFVRGLFDLNRDIETFKAHIRDFLIQLKEFSNDGADNADLYREELELEQERKKKAEMEAALSIPGMIKPSERPDDLDD